MKKLVVSRKVEDLNILLKYGFYKSASGNYEYGTKVFNNYNADVWGGIIIYAKNTKYIDVNARDVYVNFFIDSDKHAYIDEILNLGVIYELIKDEILVLEEENELL